MMCSSAQLSKTRIPISPGWAMGKDLMLRGSYLGHKRCSGSRRTLPKPIAGLLRAGFFLDIFFTQG